MSTTVYRWLVVLTVVMQFGTGLVDIAFPSLVPQALSQAAEAEPLPSFSTAPWFVASACILVLALLAATVGLLFFKRWARFLALWGTVLSLSVFPFLGAGVWSGWSSALFSASSTLWGVVLAVAFLSPLRDRFAAHE